MPRVSILIPAYNSEETILRALESAQSQTLADIEIIVIDDASSDRTVEVVLRRKQADARIRLCIREMNGGPAAARNMGLAVATGDWIALLDADDMMAPVRLENLLARAKDSDVLIADNLSMYDLHADRVVKVGIDPRLIGHELRLNCEDFVAQCTGDRSDAVDFGLLKPLMRQCATQRISASILTRCSQVEVFSSFPTPTIAIPSV
jgi:succinoglycan biosynthesis protein ExoO